MCELFWFSAQFDADYGLQSGLASRGTDIARQLRRA